MRFRFLGESGSNIGDYLTKIKEVENNFLNESILSSLGMISLNDNIKITEGSLGSNSLYKITILKDRKRKRKKVQYYRKKFHIHQSIDKPRIKD